jgi:hypothetical protein
VVVVPEAATAYFMSRKRNGKPLDLSSQTPAQITVIQTKIHNQQLRNEATARETASDAAEDGDDAIVIFDRAAPDGQAFADAECWAKLIDATPVDSQQYDLVLELRSTALLANRSVYEFGPSAKNTARQHNREDAAALGTYSRRPTPATRSSIGSRPNRTSRSSFRTSSPPWSTA